MARGAQRMVSGPVVLAMLLGGCASLQGAAEDVPPEAPSARVFRFLSPTQRDEIFPPPVVFETRDFLDRLVCPLGDQPGWKRTRRTGLVEEYELNCPGRPAASVTLDVATEAPPAPTPLRLLAAAGFVKYREAVDALESKDYDVALAALDDALRKSPKEPVYRRERIYALYSLGRTPEAIIEADDLLEVERSPIVYKYRALAARDLGLRSEVMTSIEGILVTCPHDHPLYAEAICAKGMFLANEDDERAEGLMEEGCRLEHKPCCEALESRREARAAAARALEAARSLPVKLPVNQSRPPAAPARSDAPESPPKADKAEAAPGS